MDIDKKLDDSFIEELKLPKTETEIKEDSLNSVVHFQENETIEPRYPKGNNTQKNSDTLLTWISNGNDCDKKSDLFLDTEMPITAKSLVTIKFCAAKWDGVIGGFIHQPPKPKGVYVISSVEKSRFLGWKLFMNNHKLFFYFPVEQKKHIDLGTFLPHQVYVIQTSNVFAVPSRRIGFSILNELRAIKIMLKCIIAGYQGIPENYNSNETVQLFRVGNEYAWGDLKIFSFQMQEGRTIVADMIPVLHNCCPCFYDKIRQRYFYFQGSDSVCYE